MSNNDNIWSLCGPVSSLLFLIVLILRALFCDFFFSKWSNFFSILFMEIHSNVSWGWVPQADCVFINQTQSHMQLNYGNPVLWILSIDLQHSSKLEHAAPLALAGFRSTYTKSIADRTCTGVHFQIPCHASILVFIACLFSTVQQSKEKANLSPRILALTSFIFLILHFPYFLSQLSSAFCFKQEGNLWYRFHQTAWNGSDYCL